MFLRKLIFFFVFGFITIITPTWAASPSNSIFQAGEDLFYEVSFYGVKLGSIHIISERIDKIGTKQVYKTKAIIDSYKGIPFVSLHSVFDSWLDKSMTYSHKFVGTTKQDNGDEIQTIVFDYDKGEYSNKRTQNGMEIYNSTNKIYQKWNEGLSLFFLARKYVGSKKSFLVPTIITNDSASTSLNFIGTRETVEIDAVKYPIKTIYFNGNGDWSGLYGLNGKYEGWFSDDDARVPIKAKMNVYVGSVDIELKRWTRTGWTPPK